MTSHKYDPQFLDWSDEDCKQKLEQIYPAKKDYNPLHHLNQPGVKANSMVLSMVKNLKIGMDLTSFSSPVVYLSGDSELEMRADMARPTAVLNTLYKEEDPAKRMLGVVLNMIEPFPLVIKDHLERSKPFNPVLGETFHCKYQMEDSTTSFVAEQVSHHPPITAVYIENKAKHVVIEMMLASKLSLVLNGVKVKVNGFQDFKLTNRKNEKGEIETYSWSFPSVKGSGLLFGSASYSFTDQVKCLCPVTGFEAKIKFMAGNRVRGKIFKRIGKKKKDVFITIEGNFLNKIQAKFMKNKKTIDPEWYSVSKIKHYQMQTKPVHEMGKRESRRLWGPCKYYIDQNDDENAQGAKHSIEQRQRIIKAHKKGEEFKPKLFKLMGQRKCKHGPVPHYRYINYSETTCQKKSVACADDSDDEMD